MSEFVFRNFNGIYQLRLETAGDLALIHELEEARWRATSAPLDQLFCDPKFLEYVDTDVNARIRVNEVKAAHLWLNMQLLDKSGITSRSDTLKLAYLDPKSPEVAGMKSLAERIIRERGGTRAGEVNLAEVRAFRDSYAKKFPNGDGVLTKAQLAAGDADLATLFDKVLEATGGAADLSGDKGVRAEDVDKFLELVKSYLAWDAEARAEGGPALLAPFGDATAKAVELFAELAPKMDQFFALSDLVALDPNAGPRMDATAEALAKLDLADTAQLEKWTAAAPLARPNREAKLDLLGAINPRYAMKLEALRVAAFTPPPASSGSTESQRIGRAEWSKLDATLAPYRAWQAKKPAGLPPGLGVPELEAFVSGALPGRLRALAVQDQEASSELKELTNLEKLVLYQRWFVELVNNFVSFPNLFIPGERSLFEMGTLILDGRAISLCVLVTDRPGHKKVAEASQMFVVYVELTRKDGDKVVTREVAGAVTAGTRGGIGLGKRGVFYDRDGKEWDARVIEMLVAPISLLEAAIAPFVRLRTFVATRIEKLTAGKLESMEASATKATEKGMEVPTPPPAGAPAAAPAATATAAPTAQAVASSGPPGGALGTLLVGGSVALAALGSTLAFIVKTLADVDVMHAASAILSVVVLIAALSGFLGWLKLRRRDISTLLEACGWALNGRMYLTRRLSLLFTQEPEIPEGSKTERPLITSKYIAAAEKKRARRQRRALVRVLAVTAVIAAVVYREELWALIQRYLGR